jgi:hypothetical protein
MQEPVKRANWDRPAKRAAKDERNGEKEKEREKKKTTNG